MDNDKKIKHGITAFSIIYILINAILSYNHFYWLNLLPLALLLFYLLIFHYEKYIFVLIALLPISVPLSSFKELPVDISLPSELFIILGTVYFIFKLFYENKIDKRIIVHPVTFSILLYLSWTFITSLTSTMPLVSFKFLASKIWFITIFYFVLLLLFVRFKNFYKYLWCYTIPFILVMIYFAFRLSTEGITDVVLTANYVSRPFYPDHTSYAAAIAMLIPVIGALFFIKRKATPFQKLFYIAILGIYILALILSYTRAAWLSLVIALVFMVSTLLKIKLRNTFLLSIFSIILIILAWTQIELMLSKNDQASSDNLLKHFKSMTNISNDDSNLERINRWNSAIRMFKEKPVFGFGPGTYKFNYAPYQATNDKTLISTNSGNRGNAHSEYLGPLSEMGLLGTLLVLSISLSTLFTASRVYFTAKKRKVKYLALALMIGLLSYDLHGIMNNFLDLDKLSALFWGFTAMVVALDIYHNHDADERKPIFYY